MNTFRRLRVLGLGPDEPKWVESQLAQADELDMHWLPSWVEGLAALTHTANGSGPYAAVVCSVLAFDPATMSAMRAAQPGLPVLVLASEADEPLAWEAVEQGADDYVLCGARGQLPRARLLARLRPLCAQSNYRALATRRGDLRQRLRPLRWNLNSPDELARLISTLATEAQRVLPYQQLAIYLVDPNTRELVLCAVAGDKPQHISASRYHLPADAGTTAGLAVTLGRSYRVDDFSLSTDLAPALGHAGQTQLAEMSLPIFDQDRVIGAITLTAHNSALLEHAEDELSWLADYVSLVIRAAEWARRVAELTTRETLLTSIGHTVNSTLGLRQVLQRSVSEVGERLRADRCALVHVALSHDMMTIDHEYLNPLFTERRRLKGRQIPLRVSLKRAACLLQSGQVLVSTEEEHRPLLRVLWSDLAQRYDVRSLVCVPLLDQSMEDFYCLVLMQATHVREWTDDDLTLLRGLADQLSLAVRNARLFDAMQSTALELQSKNAELEAFVYTVSHDLQAPVVSLRGFASLLQSRYGAQLDARGITYITRIAANAEFLAKMLQDLLELSRVGRLREPDEDIATEGVVESVIHDLAAAMARRNVGLQLPPVWPVVRYSRTHLRQVFSNLLSNAIKFMGPQAEPRVTLGWRRLEPANAEGVEEARLAPSFIEFFVRDNGIGIHPDYHDRIFGAFQRLKVIDVEGTGVGLSIVKRITEVHGGAVRVESAPNEGSTFYFTAPEVLRDATPPPELEPERLTVEGMNP